MTFEILQSSNYKIYTCFRGFVWTAWWWFLGNRNMQHCRMSVIQKSFVWLMSLVFVFMRTL